MGISLISDLLTCRRAEPAGDAGLQDVMGSDSVLTNCLLRSFPSSTTRGRPWAVLGPTFPARLGDALVAVSLRPAGGH